MSNSVNTGTGPSGPKIDYSPLVARVMSLTMPTFMAGSLYFTISSPRDGPECETSTGLDQLGWFGLIVGFYAGLRLAHCMYLTDAGAEAFIRFVFFPVLKPLSLISPSKAKEIEFTLCLPSVGHWLGLTSGFVALYFAYMVQWFLLPQIKIRGEEFLACEDKYEDRADFREGVLRTVSWNRISANVMIVVYLYCLSGLLCLIGTAAAIVDDYHKSKPVDLISHIKIGERTPLRRSAY